MGNDLARGPSLNIPEGDEGAGRYAKTFGLVNKMFGQQKYKDINEMDDSFQEALPQIGKLFEQLTQSAPDQTQGKQNRKLLNIQNLGAYLQQTEEIVGFDMEPFRDFIINKFSLRKTMMAISLQDISRAFKQYIQHLKHMRDNPLDPEQLEQERLKAFREDTIIREKRRKEGFFSAYTLNNEDPKEKQRVKSLQLICFKVANHKAKIIKILEKYLQAKEERVESVMSEEEDPLQSSQLLSPKKGNRMGNKSKNDSLDMSSSMSHYHPPQFSKFIPISSLLSILREVTVLLKVKLLSFEQYMQGYMPEENDPDCEEKFERYIYLGISQEQAKYLKKPSIFRDLKNKINPRKLVNALQSKKVRFIEEGLEHAKKEGGVGFSIEYFMLKIDKFFAQEKSVVLISTDDEYSKYLELEKKKQDDLEATINQLDDFFFNSTERDIGHDFEEAGHSPQHSISVGALSQRKGTDDFKLMKIPTRRAGEKSKPLERNKTVKVDSHQKMLIKENIVKKGLKVLQDQDLFRINLVKSISKYQQLIKLNHFKSDMQKQEMEKLVNILIQQLEDYDKNNKQLKSDKEISKEELEAARAKGLQEIFNFYSRQHIPQNKHFDDLKNSMSEINLGEFLCFCKDFGIPVQKNKLIEVFKRSSESHKPLKFPQFSSSITKIAVEYGKFRLEEVLDKIQLMKEDIQQLQKQVKVSTSSSPHFNLSKQVSQNEVEDLNERSEVDLGISPIEALQNFQKKQEKEGIQVQVSKNKYQTNDIKGVVTTSMLQLPQVAASYLHSSTDKSDNNKKSSTANASKELTPGDAASVIPPSDYAYDKIQLLKTKIQELLEIKNKYESMNEEQARDEMLNFLEVIDPSKYRKKIKGLHLPFNTHDKIASQERDGDKDTITTKIQAEMSIIQKTLQSESVRKSIQDYKIKKIMDKSSGSPAPAESKDKQTKEREQLAAKFRAERKLQQNILSLNSQQQKILMHSIPERAFDDGTAKNSRTNRYGTGQNANYTFEDIEKMDYKDLNKVSFTARGQDPTSQGKDKVKKVLAQQDEDEPFTPRDIIDYDNNQNAEEDEVLRKFKKEDDISQMKQALNLSKSINEATRAQRNIKANQPQSVKTANGINEDRKFQATRAVHGLAQSTLLNHTFDAIQAQQNNGIHSQKLSTLEKPISRESGAKFLKKQNLHLNQNAFTYRSNGQQSLENLPQLSNSPHLMQRPSKFVINKGLIENSASPVRNILVQDSSQQSLSNRVTPTLNNRQSDSASKIYNLRGSNLQIQSKLNQSIDDLGTPQNQRYGRNGKSLNSRGGRQRFYDSAANGKTANTAAALQQSYILKSSQTPKMPIAVNKSVIVSSSAIKKDMITSNGGNPNQPPTLMNIDSKSIYLNNLYSNSKPSLYNSALQDNNSNSLANMFNINSGQISAKNGGLIPLTTRGQVPQSGGIGGALGMQSTRNQQAAPKGLGLNSSVIMTGQQVDGVKNEIMNRAQQLNNIMKQNQERNMNNILKMQDNNMKRGLNAARKL